MDIYKFKHNVALAPWTSSILSSMGAHRSSDSFWVEEVPLELVDDSAWCPGLRASFLFLINAWLC